MKPRFDVTPATFASCLPFLACGVLLACSGLAYLQVGHWPQYSRPDPKDLELLGVPVAGAMFVGIGLAAVGTFLAAGAVGFKVLLVTLSELAEAQWSFERLTPDLTRLAYCGLGFVLFWCQLGSMLPWLMD